jgi:hypothetical protein
LSLILREEHTLGVLKNKVVRKIFEPKKKARTGGENYIIMKSLIISTLIKYY